MLNRHTRTNKFIFMHCIENTEIGIQQHFKNLVL